MFVIAEEESSKDLNKRIFLYKLDIQPCLLSYMIYLGVSNGGFGVGIIEIGRAHV